MLRPFEVINSKRSQPALITQMWVERAEKVLRQLQHMSKLLEFLGYVALTSHRFVKEYCPQLKSNPAEAKKEDKLLNKLLRLRKQEVLKEIKQMLELY